MPPTPPRSATAALAGWVHRYRYVPRRDFAHGHLVVDVDEAEKVRMLYGWLIDDHSAQVFGFDVQSGQFQRLQPATRS